MLGRPCRLDCRRPLSGPRYPYSPGPLWQLDAVADPSTACGCQRGNATSRAHGGPGSGGGGGGNATITCGGAATAAGPCGAHLTSCNAGAAAALSPAVDDSACRAPANGGGGSGGGGGGKAWWLDERGAPRPAGRRRRGLRGVVSADGRRACPDAPRAPLYSAVGQIDAEGAAGADAATCSGVLIGPDAVLTAAHCVWDAWGSGFYRSLTFAPGRRNASACSVVSPWGSVPWRHATIFKSYADALAPDVAVVRLAAPVGLRTGWAGLRAACAPAGASAAKRCRRAGAAPAPAPAARDSFRARLVGYPVDAAGADGGDGSPPPAAQGFASGHCTESACAVDVRCGGAGVLELGAAAGAALPHACDSGPGQSGAPLLDGAGRVRLVHSASMTSFMAGGEERANAATLVDKFVFDAVARWAAC
jgi:V8-like Glu-specific endopeptidase